jgi:hypothetical protein
MILFLHWLLAFALTELIEVPIYLRALRDGSGRSRGAALAIALGASAWTHPIVCFALPALWKIAFAPVFFVPGETTLTGAFVARALVFFVVVEGFAIAGEAAYLRVFAVARALRWSAVANLTSSSLGVVLTLVSGWP